MSQVKDAELKESIYQFVANYIKEKGISPTVREISLGCGKVSVSTVSYHLDRLEAEGRIYRSWYKSRSIRLQKQAIPEDEMTRAIYDLILESIEREGQAPTQREIADACHISKGSVQQYLTRLETQGKILRGEGHRNIQVLSEN